MKEQQLVRHYLNMFGINNTEGKCEVYQEEMINNILKYFAVEYYYTGTKSIELLVDYEKEIGLLRIEQKKYNHKRIINKKRETLFDPMVDMIVAKEKITRETIKYSNGTSTKSEDYSIVNYIDERDAKVLVK